MQLSDDEYQQQRSAALDRILQSTAKRKLIVAGPGTGKTYTFQRLLEASGERGLAMTFLLGLVRDLTDAIGDSTDVYSFHGFARRLLHQIDGTGVTRSAHYYPPLAHLLVEDVRIVDGASVDEMVLGGLFRNLAEEDSFLERALASGRYYDAVGYDDAVYRVLSALEADDSRIPYYPQVVVDEFQDFCPLEVELVKRLATKSPTLIVGDDDQALYAFRDARPEAIREIARANEYERFELPFCTRCTEVVVSATHTVVHRAQARGLLSGRLDKPYDCFIPEKRSESATYPKIIHARCSTQTLKAPYMGRYIEQAVRAIETDEIVESHAKNFPTVLVIGPNPFLSQVEAHLRGAGFANVLTNSNTTPELSFVDAYRLLAASQDSNLGWRILLQLLMPAGWEGILRGCLRDTVPLREAVSETFAARHLATAALLRRWLDGEELSSDDLGDLALALGVDVSDVVAVLAPATTQPVEIKPDEPTIMLTSLMASKGLQAAHVFVVGMNAGHFPRGKPTDAEVCQLLVALTRTRKSCTVVSTGRLGAAQLGESEFIRWLAPHLNTVTVNQEYFRARS